MDAEPEPENEEEDWQFGVRDPPIILGSCALFAMTGKCIWPPETALIPAT